VRQPLCIKAKPAATFMHEILTSHQKDVLQAVQSAMQARPGPHHLSYLLVTYPPNGIELKWAQNQQELWFITE